MAGKVTVGLAMSHRLQRFIQYGLNGLRKGDEHPAYTSVRSMALFTLAI